MKFKKLKEKWVKERLYTARLSYRGFTICEWDNDFETWRFKNRGMNSNTNMQNTLIKFFWYLGNDCIDKFFCIRRIVRGNSNFSFWYKNWYQQGEYEYELLKQVGLL